VDIDVAVAVAEIVDAPLMTATSAWRRRPDRAARSSCCLNRASTAPISDP
jgi:hypothetical protein